MSGKAPPPEGAVSFGYFSLGRQRKEHTPGVMTPEEPTRRSAVKHENVDDGEDSGLLYYNARYYDPMIGRFITPDTIIPKLTFSQSFNRYMYVIGNPINYNDPSGHSFKKWVKNIYHSTTKAITAAGTGAINVYHDAINTCKKIGNGAEKVWDKATSKDWWKDRGKDIWGAVTNIDFLKTALIVVVIVVVAFVCALFAAFFLVAALGITTFWIGVSLGIIVGTLVGAGVGYVIGGVSNYIIEYFDSDYKYSKYHLSNKQYALIGAAAGAVGGGLGGYAGVEFDLKFGSLGQFIKDMYRGYGEAVYAYHEGIAKGITEFYNGLNKVANFFIWLNSFK